MRYVIDRIYSLTLISSIPGIIFPRYWYATKPWNCKYTVISVDVIGKLQHALLVWESQGLVDIVEYDYKSLIDGLVQDYKQLNNVNILLTKWSYCSLALSHRNIPIWYNKP